MLDFPVCHVVVEADADPIFAIHVVRRIHRTIPLFQSGNLVGRAFEGTRVEPVDIEITENLIPYVKRQDGAGGGKCLKGHLLRRIRQGKAKVAKLFTIHVPIIYPVLEAISPCAGQGAKNGLLRSARTWPGRSHPAMFSLQPWYRTAQC